MGNGHRPKINIRFLVAGLLVVIVLFVLGTIYTALPPGNFPSRIVIEVKPGTYLSQAADILATNNLIKSPLLFKLLVVSSSGHRQILSGQYLFEEPQSALRIAYRLSRGIQGLSKVKVTLNEGQTIKEMAIVLGKTFENFDAQSFIELARGKEGYLFPDTYFFYENVRPEEVISLLEETFRNKLTGISAAIKTSGKTEAEIIKMASIVEREARGKEDRRIIAGILWKRLSIKMPLQVDAPFYYLFGKTSAELTLDDLALDSPYNLYKNAGLPPSPIANPGLEALQATVNPIVTDNLYFLSDNQGKMHYAVTHDEHVANKRKYLP